MVSATPPRGAMTGAREWWAPAIRKPEGGYKNEASSIFENWRHRLCRGRGCFAGDRAVDAGDQMAHDHELAEVARHALRRRRNHVQGRRRGDRRQVPDSDFRRRRNRARPAGRRRRTERHRRVRPYRLVLLFRQGPNVRHGHIDCVRPQPALNQGWFTLGGGKEALNEFYKKYNCMALLAGNTGCQMGGWFRKEINSVDNLKGLKMRIGGFPGRVIQKLGAVPQQIAAGDIYPALEKGTIDAAEWVGPYDDEKLGFYKVAPHYYYPGWWEGGSMLLTFVNLDKWNVLPKAYQAVLEQAGHYANTWMIAKYDEVNPAALRRLLANGVKLHGFSPAIMEACFKAAKELHSEIAATNESFKKVYDAMTKYTNNGYQRFQVAELSYDSFMVRHSRA